MTLSPTPFTAHFGGPDRPPGALRDLLEARLAAVPAGGSVLWVTYYFRDRPLARALLDAVQRGVHVTLVLEGRPRVARANRDVLAMLSGPDGLGDRLRVLAARGLPSPPGLAWKPQIHEKIYCFSHPQPVALVGSFNPSGDRPERHPEVIAQVGDHHVAHNVLVEIRDAALVDCLSRHVDSLHRDGSWLWARAQRTDFELGDSSIHFWPRRGTHPVEALLERYGSGARVRIAASHIRSARSVNLLARLARRGAEVRVAAEHTRRRVPRRTQRRLLGAGVGFERLGAAENVPMHLKFVLAEDARGHHAAFGSFNWTLPSRWLNHEVAVITRDGDLFEALDRRWSELSPKLSPRLSPRQSPGGLAG